MSSSTTMPLSQDRSGDTDRSINRGADSSTRTSLPSARAVVSVRKPRSTLLQR